MLFRFLAKLFSNRPATSSAVALGVLAAAASFTTQIGVLTLGWRIGSIYDAPWRLLTSQFVHLGPAHFSVNFLAAVLLGVVCDRLHVTRQLFGATLASFVAVCTGLEWGPWPLNWYVGFSGVLHGLFAWLCLSIARTTTTARFWSARAGALALYAGGLIKVVSALSIPVGSPGWLEIPQATPVHLYGYAGGTLWALLRRGK